MIRYLSGKFEVWCNWMESCCFYLPLRPLNAINLLLKFPLPRQVYTSVT